MPSNPYCRIINLPPPLVRDAHQFRDVHRAVAAGQIPLAMLSFRTFLNRKTISTQRERAREDLRFTSLSSFYIMVVSRPEHVDHNACAEW